jgi:SAM-dependent methyltransferase
MFDRFLHVGRTLEFYASHPVRRIQEIGTAAGARFDIPWLVYNPLVFGCYQRMAEMNAPGVMGAFAEGFPEARRLVDVGAGSGGYAAEAMRRGWHVAACEHARTGRAMARRQGVDVHPFDLERDPPSDLVGPFDVAYCFEVAEHVPPPLGDALVRYLARLAPTVAFTAARPGQGGIGHVNEQPRAFWIERFEAAGLAYDARVTELLHAGFLARGVGAWLADNLSVFRRVADVRTEQP